MRKQPISTVMTTDVVSIDLDQRLSDAYHALKGAPYHHIPVLDGAPFLAGLVTTVLLMRRTARLP